MARRRSRWPRFSRDAILFSAGLLGIAYETVVGKADRPTLLFLFAAMVGLPAFLWADERNQSRMWEEDDPGEEDDDEEPPPPKPKPKPKPRPPQPRSSAPSVQRPSVKPKPRPRR